METITLYRLTQLFLRGFESVFDFIVKSSWAFVETRKRCFVNGFRTISRLTRTRNLFSCSTGLSSAEVLSSAKELTTVWSNGAVVFCISNSGGCNNISCHCVRKMSQMN